MDEINRKYVWKNGLKIVKIWTIKWTEKWAKYGLLQSKSLKNGQQNEERAAHSLKKCVTVSNRSLYQRSLPSRRNNPNHLNCRACVEHFVGRPRENLSVRPKNAEPRGRLPVRQHATEIDILHGHCVNCLLLARLSRIFHRLGSKMELSSVKSIVAVRYNLIDRFAFEFNFSIWSNSIEKQYNANVASYWRWVRYCTDMIRKCISESSDISKAHYYWLPL